MAETLQILCEQAEELLEKWKHPDPYRPPTAPGGSKFERNLVAPILDRTGRPFITLVATKADNIFQLHRRRRSTRSEERISRRITEGVMVSLYIAQSYRRRLQLYQLLIFVQSHRHLNNTNKPMSLRHQHLPLSSTQNTYSFRSTKVHTFVDRKARFRRRHIQNEQLGHALVSTPDTLF